jgi:hypothetical protein
MISVKPIKNSNPIKIRAIKGAVCQLPILRSTNVYSKGSIGYSLVYPENRNTTPIKAHSKLKDIFFNMIKMQNKKKAFFR